ncbi:MAG: sulfur carrier protein ThiS [Actinomycetota bacterium]
MNVVANGKPLVAAPASTVRDLIVAYGLDPRFVVVELNGQALERKRYPEVALHDGDRLELVRAVAGG